MKCSLKVFLAVVMLIAMVPKCFSQRFIVGARGEFHLSAGYNFPMGKKTIGDDLPLLTNMKGSPSFDVRFLTLVSKSMSIGAWAGSATFKDWSAPGSSLYNGTTMRFSSFGPSVMYNLPRAPGKNVSFCLALSPGLSKVTVTTSKDSEINGEPKTDPLQIRSTRFSMAAHAGLRFTFSHSIGGTALLGYQHTQADSRIFPDKSFSYINLRAGIFYRLFKDKRYKYSNL